MFTAIKDNQPTLFAHLDALPWTTVPIGHTMRDCGHGREERRTLQVLPAPEGIFPYAQQAFLIERYVHDLDAVPISAIAALGITALSADHAAPERLAHLVPGHWGIEALGPVTRGHSTPRFEEGCFMRQVRLSRLETIP